ncbi:MFS transporter [Steroidobacter sp.]|uniref:MFS transporter n=1 Tax=Steroidobacter sp. TaxID=1978227 RepID=UPI001A6394D7|nr:MFS transporter [Steroidobacter sp.]MBL8268891.1 MFS transporter [Steroidobacter sp.]
MPLSLIAYLLTGGVAPLVMWFGPLLVGGYVDALGLSEQQAVLLLSVELAGYALSGAIAFTLISTVNWRHIVLGAFLVVIAGNLVAAGVHTFTPLLLVRFVTGIGAGMLMTMSMIAIGLTAAPERNYGLWTAMQILTPAIILPFLPGLIAKHGLAAPFLIVATLALALLWVFRYYPIGSGQKSGGSALLGTRRVLLLGALGLLGVFIFFGGESTVWAFAERMGMHASLPVDAIGRALSIGAIAGLGGALAASAFGNRLGRLAPLAISMVVSLTGAALLIQANTPAAYTVALCAICAAWNYSGPYLQAVIANLDSSGRLLALLAIIIPGSMSAGPALATLLLTEGRGYLPVVWMLAIALPSGLLLIYPAARIKTPS